MTGKQALLRIKVLPGKIAAADARARSVYYRLTSMTVQYDRVNVKSSKDPDKMSAFLIANERAEELKAEYNDLLTDVQATLNEMTVDRQAKCLWLRYVEGLDPKLVAVRMHYSSRGERKVHEAALEAFERVWGERKTCR